MSGSHVPTDRRRPDSQFQGLVEHSLDGMSIVQNNRFLYVNPKFCEIFGYDRDEVLQRLTPLDLVDQSDHRQVEEKIEARLRGLEPTVAFSFKGKRKDGSLIDVEIHGSAMEIGGQRALIASLVDVTDRNRTMTLLRESGQRIKRERDTAQVYLNIAGVMILVLDREGRVALINRRGCSILGYAEPKDLIGKPWIDTCIPARLRDDVRTAFDRFLNENDTSFEHRENLVVSRDGHERLISWHNVQIANEKGDIVAMLSSGEDVTEVRQLVERLRVSEARFRQLFEEAPDAILVFDYDNNRIIDANRKATELFECERDEISKRGLWSFYPPEQPDGKAIEITFTEHIKDVLQNRQSHFERLIRTARGSERYCRVQLVSLPSPNEKLIRASFVDITQIRNTDRNLQRVTRALKTLTHANTVMMRATDHDSLFREMCRVTVEVGGYRMAWIGLAQHDPEKTVRPAAHFGYDAGYLENARISWADDERGRGPTGTAVRTGKVQVNRAFASNPRVEPWRTEALKRGYASSIALPLMEAGQAFGALTIYAAEPGAFEPEEVELLAELAGDLSYGCAALEARLAREKVLKRQEAALEETIQAIASTVEYRDVYTAGHQRRVAAVALAIAREMGLPEERIHGLRLACIVHDLGKINIPAEILNKPGKLSALEYDFIKTHPKSGYDILKPIAFPWPIAEIVLQHHERLDGSGYPNGLKGDAILLEARIIAVADVVESMNSHRPYRPSRGIEAALAEIREGRGRLYDPAVVDACSRLIESGRLRLENGILAPNAEESLR